MLVLLWTTVLDSRGLLLLQGGRPRQRGQRSLDCRLILYDFCCVEASGRARASSGVVGAFGYIFAIHAQAQDHKLPLCGAYGIRR